MSRLGMLVRAAVVVATLAAVACWGTEARAAAGPDALPAEGAMVTSVDVRGCERINRQTVLNNVSAMAGRTVTPKQLADDVQALSKLGFFRQVPPPEVEMTPTGARITYVVAEFPPIRRVEFTGNTVFTDDELREMLGLGLGEIFNRDVVERRLRAIEQAYRARGYVARISAEVRLDPSGMLVVPIHEVRVADVDIEGLRQVRESTVLKALLLREGRLFNEADLRADFVRLQQLGVFESIEPDINPAPNGDVIITWRLTETRTRALSFGLSYSPQENLVGTVQFTESNFRGRAERLRVGLNFGSIERQIGGEVAYSTPLLAQGTAYNARIFSLPEYRFSQNVLAISNQDTDRYFERHVGAQVGAARDLGRGRAISLSGRYEDVTIRNLPPEFLSPDIPSLDSTILSAAGQLTRDRRDSLVYPTRGDYALASADVGFVTRGASDAGGVMVKPQVELRAYLPVGRRAAAAENGQPNARTRVLAVRALIGTSAGSLPFFEQYFIGGVNNLRGYTEDRFWGRHAILTSAELRVPVGGGGLVGVAFVDAGQAWGSEFQFADVPGFNTDFRQSSGFNPRIGAGVGVRYITPLGPLRLDFAFGDKFRTHFTVGQSF